MLRLSGIDWVNLQGGPAGRRLIEQYPRVIDAIDPPVALDEFAAATAATDLVISIDTMAAHCAGALGHPLWLLVPHSPHWAWGLGRDHTPWYPTARLLPTRPPQLARRHRSADAGARDAALNRRAPDQRVTSDPEEVNDFNMLPSPLRKSMCRKC